jgi:hypothetical protein
MRQRFFFAPADFLPHVDLDASRRIYQPAAPVFGFEAVPSMA